MKTRYLIVSPLLGGLFAILYNHSLNSTMIFMGLLSGFMTVFIANLGIMLMYKDDMR